MTPTATVSTLPSTAPLVRPATRVLDVALLGLGRVGAAVASLALAPPEALGVDVRIGGALVRDCARARGDGLHRRVRLTADGAGLIARRPDVVVEVLGGLEPARTLVLAALERGIPVVTANKSLMAAHADELLAAAAQTSTPLRYEACVLAGVPFLGTFAERPLAARLTRVTGIVNGTTNYVLTQMEREQRDFEDALADAQRRGFAEPDPASDVDGIDAAEKLAVLVRHFGRRSVRPAEIETRGIRSIQAADLVLARAFGGVIKFVAHAEWTSEGVEAFVGPAFVPSGDKLAAIDGVENAVRLGGAHELFYAGPGAGPAVTAATILDDVAQCRAARGHRLPQAPAEPARCGPPATPWFVRLSGVTLPHGSDIADLLGSYGVWLRRVSEVVITGGRQACYLLTWPSPPATIERALAALADAGACHAFGVRSLERCR
jgi:homoserine dehydrogenase